MHFKEYLNLLKNFNNKSICVEENFSWVKGVKLPDINLDLPVIEKKSKILILNDKLNPIFVQLEDKSKLFFTYDEFKRIAGTPSVGKTMYLKMQRLGNDTSNLPSRITMCQVL
jgi:hypothetical protein